MKITAGPNKKSGNLKVPVPSAKPAVLHWVVYYDRVVNGDETFVFGFEDSVTYN